jgi:hypothetical protein
MYSIGTSFDVPFGNCATTRTCSSVSDSANVAEEFAAPLATSAVDSLL